MLFGLQHGDTIAFCVEERNVMSYAGNFHRFPEYFAAGIRHDLHGFLDIIHSDNH